MGPNAAEGLAHSDQTTRLAAYNYGGRAQI
jgi:hypothetical protein